MFGKKKTKISIEDYEKHRDMLLKWKWLTEVYDSKTKVNVYKPTHVGVQVYSTIVRAVGTDTLVNNFKLKRPEVESNIVPLGANPDAAKLDLLFEYNILTTSIDPQTDIEKTELTPFGAKLFIAFFVSNNREIGTLPGDAVAKFFKIMQNMPRYTETFSKIMDNIGKGFRSLDNTNMQKQHNSYQYGNPYGSDNPYSGYSTKKHKSKSKKSSKPKKPKHDISDDINDHFSRQGKSMMDDMMKKWK